jgi:hypothetical protein
LFFEGNSVAARVLRRIGAQGKLPSLRAPRQRRIGRVRAVAAIAFGSAGSTKDRISALICMLWRSRKGDVRPVIL